MSGLTDLDAQFADGNVMLGILLGAIGAASKVRALMPDPSNAAGPGTLPATEPPTVEPFVAMLLGVVALHIRLTTFVEEGGASRGSWTDDSETMIVTPLIGLAR